MKNYILYDIDNTVIQFIRCDESEIELYQSSYIEHDEDTFIFDNNYTYKVKNNKVIKTERVDNLYLNQVKKQNRQILVDNIEVTYNGIIYQGDEASQDRMSRAINGLPDDITTIQWKAKCNSSQELTKLDLKQILYLAGQEQTKIWFNKKGEIKI